MSHYNADHAMRVQTYLVTLTDIVFALSLSASTCVYERFSFFRRRAVERCTHPQPYVPSQCRSRGAPLFPAPCGELAICTALLARHSVPEVKLVSEVLTKLCSWQTPLTHLARDWFCCCLNGILFRPCRITTEPFIRWLRAALLALDAPVFCHPIAPIHGPEICSGERPAALLALFARL